MSFSGLSHFLSLSGRAPFSWITSSSRKVVRKVPGTDLRFRGGFLSLRFSLRVLCSPGKLFDFEKAIYSLQGFFFCPVTERWQQINNADTCSWNLQTGLFGSEVLIRNRISDANSRTRLVKIGFGDAKLAGRTPETTPNLQWIQRLSQQHFLFLPQKQQGLD